MSSTSGTRWMSSQWTRRTGSWWTEVPAYPGPTPVNKFIKITVMSNKDVVFCMYFVFIVWRISYLYVHIYHSLIISTKYSYSSNRSYRDQSDKPCFSGIPPQFM